MRRGRVGIGGKLRRGGSGGGQLGGGGILGCWIIEAGCGGGGFDQRTRLTLGRERSECWKGVSEASVVMVVGYLRSKTAVKFLAVNSLAPHPPLPVPTASNPMLRTGNMKPVPFPGYAEFQ